MDWLIAGGIEKERVADSMSQSLGWLHLDVTAAGQYYRGDYQE